VSKLRHILAKKIKSQTICKHNTLHKHFANGHRLLDVSRTIGQSNKIMLANMYVESHVRELLEQSFEVAVERCDGRAKRITREGKAHREDKTGTERLKLTACLCPVRRRVQEKEYSFSEGESILKPRSVPLKAGARVRVPYALPVGRYFPADDMLGLSCRS
jgi:hypothetical protein